MEKNKLKEILKTALISRSLDERIWMLNRQGRAAIAASGQGHEISQLGCVEALDSRKDHFLIYYRQFTLTLALGTTPEEQLRNFLAKEGDIMSGARQFPLHGSHPRVDLFSFSNVVATQLPQAVGVALADKMNNKDSVTIVFFGDGAASQGDCHEAMNFASIHKLPVVFFCENNGYAISVPLEKQMNIESIASRSSAYNMPGVQVDGTDFFSVYDVTKEAANLAREGGGPTLIESKVERLLPHTTDDDHTRYRSKSDIEFMSQRDPIPIFSKKLIEMGIVTKDEILQLENEATLVINQATEKVEDEPFPSIDNMLLHSDLE
jgi:2-oxoisovalerate dehydrogenase E1 component alpha subunit